MNMERNYSYTPAPKGYTIAPADTLIDDVFCLKRKTLERKIKLLQEQIEQRKKNLEQNLYQIELDLCTCGTIGHQIPYSNVEGQQKLILMHKLPLHKERRKLQTEYLRDTAMLRGDLLDTILEYQSLDDKKDLLS